MEQTARQYREIAARCKQLFMDKARDYGISWSIMRLPSVTDQLMIKAERIRALQENKVNRVGDSESAEFIGIVNYCIIALMLWSRQQQGTAIPANAEELSARYDAMLEWAFEVMEAKNHDYGEAWRKMRVSSITDIILMRLLRLKQIEDNDGQTAVSEGPEANYIDMLNYAIFALILKQEAAP